MNKSEFLSFVRSHYSPAHVTVDAVAISQLRLSGAPIGDMVQPVPFPHPEAGAAYCDSEVRNTLRYLMALAALQYRFWWQIPDEPAVQRYALDGRVGSSALTARLEEIWGEDGQPGSIVLEAAESTLGVGAAFGDDLPGHQSRRDVLSEVLVQDAGTEALEFVFLTLAYGKHFDISTAAELARRMPVAFGDPFLKKAMLFLTMVGQSWIGKRLEVQVDLCAFADYQVPNVLRHHGVLRYGAELSAAIARPVSLASGEVMESAIRSATVLACEAIAQHFGVKAHDVDQWLFQQRKLPRTPFHLCYTSHY
jgi:hypothetical protein